MSVEITRLPNGITVVTDAMFHLETTALGIWIKAGARDEAPEENLLLLQFRSVAQHGMEEGAG